jgi:capsid protein
MTLMKFALEVRISETVCFGQLRVNHVFYRSMIHLRAIDQYLGLIAA